MLDKEQQLQLKKQLESHKHERYVLDLKIGSLLLKDFNVFPNVLRPEKVTAIEFARWLEKNPYLYEDKKVLDMGCGSGILGITVGLKEALEVVFSDISQYCVDNTSENVSKFLYNSRVILGNLFENIFEKFDVIIFNHPFFSNEPIHEQSVSKSWSDRGSLLHRFLKEVKDYLNEGGFVIMPYFHMAGEVNDPGVQAPFEGYFVDETFKGEINTELHKGLVSFYVLRLEA